MLTRSTEIFQAYSSFFQSRQTILDDVFIVYKSEKKCLIFLKKHFTFDSLQERSLGEWNVEMIVNLFGGKRFVIIS